jgi:hypothetical protein
MRAKRMTEEARPWGERKKRRGRIDERRREEKRGEARKGEERIRAVLEVLNGGHRDTTVKVQNVRTHLRERQDGQGEEVGSERAAEQTLIHTNAHAHKGASTHRKVQRKDK